MENILWFLVIGGLFFLMHKMGLGCCGGHGGHSHKKDHAEHHEGTKSIDNVSEGKESSKPSTGSCH